MSSTPARGSSSSRPPERDGWTVAPAPADLRDRRCEITGPPDRKMMINALNSGARVFMCDFEDACSPTWTNVVEGQRNLARRRPPDDLARDAGEELRAERRDRDARRPPARLAPRGAARHRRRRAGLGVALRLRARVLPQRAASCSSAGAGRTSTSRSSRATTRRALWARAFAHRRGDARRPARLDPLHRADRDDPGGVRDGRDPLRAARLRLRAQRRPLGLHLQHDQEARRRAARPRPGDDDGAVHARLHRAARPRRATGAARTRSAAWRRSSRRGAIPR